MTPNRIKAVLALSITLFWGTALADVVMEQKISMDAAGALSMLGSTGTVRTIVSGDRGRTESRMEANSGLMQSFAKNSNSATIVRLDQDRMINLMLEEQKYSEVTFEQMRAQYQQAIDQIEQAQQSGGLPVSEGECEWSEPVVKVDKTGESERFGGVKAKQILITAFQTCTVPDTGKSCDMAWSLDYWLAKRMPGDDEIMAFQKGMAKALGADEQMAMIQAQARGMLSMFEEGWDEVLDESGDLNGYPVKTVMTMEMGGENCTTGMGQPIAMDDIWGEAANAGINAATNAAAASAGNAVGQAAAESMGDSVGGSIAGSAIGAASKKVVSGLFNKFKKKKKEEKEEKTAAATDPAAARVVLFTLSSELTHVDEESVADSLFEVPSGWEKVEAAGF